VPLSAWLQLTRFRAFGMSSSNGGTGMESSPRSTGHSRSSRSRSRSGGNHSSSSGHTLFTAECSQQFRSPGVVPKKTSLRELLSVRSTNLSQPPPPSSSPQPFFRPLEPRVFDDDDPVERTPQPLRDEERVGASAEASSGRSVAIATHCEYSALVRLVR
jgi:hypothetical protein